MTQRLALGLNTFLEVLRAGRPSAVRVELTFGLDSYVDTWMQANWESLVEAAVDADGKTRVEIYGDGADCQSGSRVFDPAAVATHEVRCRSETGGSVVDAITSRPVVLPKAGLLVDRFVTMDAGWFVEEPPFDCVLTEVDGREIVLSLNSVELFLAPLDSKT